MANWNHKPGGGGGEFLTDSTKSYWKATGENWFVGEKDITRVFMLKIPNKPNFQQKINKFIQTQYKRQKNQVWFFIYVYSTQKVYVM